MALLRDNESKKVVALIRLGYCNPFQPERIELEREVLGDDFVDTDPAWHKCAREEGSRPNVERIARYAEDLTGRLRQRLVEGVSCEPNERSLYENLVLYFLYHKYSDDFRDYITRAYSRQNGGAAVVAFHPQFQEDVVRFFALPNYTFSLDESDHLFACFFQLRHAFHHIFENIIGGSSVSARLRAAAWQSIFTCDMQRYRRGLYRRMADITTLITGPSGTGKELVARAIGLSRYIPFDGRHRRFEAHIPAPFHALSLSALSPTLIESELFGHTKGSFTGATNDRVGYFEACAEHGTVFLDEIGELEPSIQVKLLRVLETRVFQRIGDTSDRHFHGKTLAATNRDLATEMKEGRFREDLYYRLCSDVIVTPSLREQLQEAPEHLHDLVLFLCTRAAGPQEAAALSEEVERWVDEHLGSSYPWPGNVRELEQCVRNVLVRRSYQPARSIPSTPRETFIAQVRSGALSLDELTSHYCTLVYAETGSYQETARRLGLDRRTVKGRIRADLLEQYRSR